MSSEPERPARFAHQFKRRRYFGALPPLDAGLTWCQVPCSCFFFQCRTFHSCVGAELAASGAGLGGWAGWADADTARSKARPANGTAIAAIFFGRLIQNSLWELAVRPTSPGAAFAPPDNTSTVQKSDRVNSFLSLPTYDSNNASGLVCQKTAPTASLT